MAGIGHQRQGACPQAAAGFDDDEDRVEADARRHRPVELVGREAVGMAVCVPVPVLVVIVLVGMVVAGHARIITVDGKAIPGVSSRNAV